MLLGVWVMALATAGACSQDEGGKPQVTVRRFAHGASCPVRCKACGAAVTRALDYLSESVKGGFEKRRGGDVVVASLMGLAFMANGVHADKVERLVDFVLGDIAGLIDKRKSHATPVGLVNWDLAFSAIFLSEYYAAKPTAALERKLRLLAEKICENCESTGGWGHAPSYDYGDLVVATNAVLAGLGSLKMVRIPVSDTVIAKGVKYLEASSAGGVVGYSPREGQKGWGKAGRASGAAYAMLKCGATGPFYGRVANYVKGNIETIPLDHASPTLHYLMGGLYCAMLGPGAWREYRETFFDGWLSAQQDDGSFICPTTSDLLAQGKEDVDQRTGPNFMTAVFAIIVALPLDRTHLTHVTLGRAKPTPTAREERKDKEKEQEATNAYLGLLVRPSYRSLVVVAVRPDSPAADAGILLDDVIVEFNKKPVTDAAALRDAVRGSTVGSKVILTVLQNGERKSVEVILTIMPTETPTPTPSGEEREV